MRALCLAMLGLLAGGCAGGPGREPGASAQAIVGGAIDSGDPSVIALYGVDGEQAFLCTASVVAPRVLITAAHCLSTQLHSTATRYFAYLGPNFNAASSADLLPVVETHAHPSWDKDNIEAGHDVGIAILRDAVPVAPLPLRRVPLEVAEIGRPLRLVGYGASDGTAQTGSGQKRQTQTALDDFDESELVYNDTTHLTCNGDSGGPAFLTRGGVEEIAGITSYGDRTCQIFGVDSRVDAELAFIDRYLAPADAPAGGPRDLSVRPAAQYYVGAEAKADAIAPKGNFVEGGCAMSGHEAAQPGLGLLLVALVLAQRARRVDRRRGSRHDGGSWLVVDAHRSR